MFYPHSLKIKCKCFHMTTGRTPYRQLRSLQGYPGSQAGFRSLKVPMGGVEGMAQLVELLPNRHKALGSISSTAWPEHGGACLRSQL